MFRYACTSIHATDLKIYLNRMIREYICIIFNRTCMVWNINVEYLNI